ncbi:uncharacterized protein N7458_007955 [Penicillium daleae]|uniref:Uncharacterized protein n=1 Tax=Penicillium daleae TaxID=63821 RepID=A0AAD6C4H0_9EURO|nr:uncharacterized protein N7458_007955 [Penicillium daleae]KAJ5444083.1 hypothetical protein N7458_007955 [Penicillium daleae]
MHSTFARVSTTTPLSSKSATRSAGASAVKSVAFQPMASAHAATLSLGATAGVAQYCGTRAHASGSGGACACQAVLAASSGAAGSCARTSCELASDTLKGASGSTVGGGQYGLGAMTVTPSMCSRSVSLVPSSSVSMKLPALPPASGSSSDESIGAAAVMVITLVSLFAFCMGRAYMVCPLPRVDAPLVTPALSDANGDVTLNWKAPARTGHATTTDTAELLSSVDRVEVILGATLCFGLLGRNGQGSGSHVESKHPEVDVHVSVNRWPFDEELCSDVDVDMDCADPKIQRELHSDVDSRVAHEVKGLQLASAHGHLRRQGEVRLARDAEAVVKRPRDGESGRVGIVRRRRKARVVAADGKDPVAGVLVRAEPVGQSKATGEVTGRVEDEGGTAWLDWSGGAGDGKDTRTSAKMPRLMFDAVNSTATTALMFKSLNASTSRPAASHTVPFLVRIGSELGMVDQRIRRDGVDGGELEVRVVAEAAADARNFGKFELDERALQQAEQADRLGPVREDAVAPGGQEEIRLKRHYDAA